jgi:hypothetical protein
MLRSNKGACIISREKPCKDESKENPQINTRIIRTKERR